MNNSKEYNYQDFKKLLESIKNDNKKPTLLLHACCGPCSSYVIDFLKNYFKITLLYYNPNIYPHEEYIKRLENINKLLLDYKEVELKVVDAPHEDYLKVIEGLENLPEGDKRCYECYKMRLTKTKEIAEQEGFDYFSTVMSISPHKNSDWINEIGFSLEGKSLFLYSNFKKEEGYKKSIIMSKEKGLYRQDYCGCEFSHLDD